MNEVEAQQQDEAKDVSDLNEVEAQQQDEAKVVSDLNEVEAQQQDEAEDVSDLNEVEAQQKDEVKDVSDTQRQDEAKGGSDTEQQGEAEDGFNAKQQGEGKVVSDLNEAETQHQGEVNDVSDLNEAKAQQHGEGKDASDLNEAEPLQQGDAEDVSELTGADAQQGGKVNDVSDLNEVEAQRRGEVEDTTLEILNEGPVSKIGQDILHEEAEQAVSETDVRCDKPEASSVTSARTTVECNSTAEFETESEVTTAVEMEPGPQETHDVEMFEEDRKQSSGHYNEPVTEQYDERDRKRDAEVMNEFEELKGDGVEQEERRTGGIDVAVNINGDPKEVKSRNKKENTGDLIDFEDKDELTSNRNVNYGSESNIDTESNEHTKKAEGEESIGFIAGQQQESCERVEEAEISLLMELHDPSSALASCSQEENKHDFPREEEKQGDGESLIHTEMNTEAERKLKCVNNAKISEEGSDSVDFRAAQSAGGQKIPGAKAREAEMLLLPRRTRAAIAKSSSASAIPTELQGKADAKKQKKRQSNNQKVSNKSDRWNTESEGDSEGDSPVKVQ